MAGNYKKVRMAREQIIFNARIETFHSSGSSEQGATYQLTAEMGTTWADFFSRSGLKNYQLDNVRLISF